MNGNEQVKERYELSVERIRAIAVEETVAPVYREYFRTVAGFISDICDIWERVETKGYQQCTPEELREENEAI